MSNLLQHMKFMEILPQPEELSQLQFIPAPASTGGEVELSSPRNPVTHGRVEVILMGHKNVGNGQTGMLSPGVRGKAPM